MIGDLAQVVMLTTYANAVLMGQHQLQQDLLTTHSTCKFCQKIQFTKKTNNGTQILANNPNEWIKFLLDNNTAFIHFRVLWNDQSEMTEPQLAGFVGGGLHYFVEVINLDKTHDLYIPRWKVNPNKNAGEKTWLINYELVKTISNIGVDIRTTTAVAKDLKQALIDIENFASKQQLANFANCFERSLNILIQKKWDNKQEDHLMDDFLTVQGAALIHAASNAWVFGGMGSWNDLSFKDERDQHQYNQLSKHLYLLLYEALEVGLASWATQ